MPLTATAKQTLWIGAAMEYNKQFLESLGIASILNLVVPAFGRLIDKSKVNLSATDTKIASIDRQPRPLLVGAIPLTETGTTANSSTVSLAFSKHRDVFGINPAESNWNVLMDRVPISYDDYLNIAASILETAIPDGTEMRMQYVEHITMFNSLLNVREGAAKYSTDAIFNAPTTNAGWAGLVMPTLGTYSAARSTLEIPIANAPYAVNSLKDVMNKLGCLGNITIIATTGVIARLAPLAYQGQGNATNTSFQFDNGVTIISNGFIDANFTTLFPAYAGQGFVVVSDLAMGITSFAEKSCLNYDGQPIDGHILSAAIDPFMPDFALNMKSKTQFVAEPNGATDNNSSFGCKSDIQMWAILSKVQPRYRNTGVTGILRCAFV